MAKKPNNNSAFRKFLKSPVSTIMIFVLAAALLAIGGIGGAIAVPTYESNFYTSQIGMQDIGVSLLENGQIRSHRNYNSTMDGTWDLEVPGVLRFDGESSGSPFKFETLVPGVTYPEVLQIQNTGSINTYNRVTIYKYWLDEEENKTNKLSPKMIHLHYVNKDVWMHDTNSDTDERTVLYYAPLLLGTIDGGGTGQLSVPFVDTVTLDGVLATMVEKDTSEDGKTITTKYKYNDYYFCVEVTVDAVQEKNAEDAILSCWGKNVNIMADLSMSGIG